MSHASVPADLAAPLPIARYRFRARVLDPLALPQYAGSLLRGQFGAALRHLACMTRQSTCAGCPLQATCPYTRIFEAPAPQTHQLQRFSAIPNAYVVEPPPPPLERGASSAERSLQPGQELVFHMVLVGHALEQLPLVIVAWQRALARGLGKGRSRLELEEVCWIDAAGPAQPVWSAEQPHLQVHAAALHIPAMPVDAQAMHLHIHTPLRLQRQGQPLPPRQLNARTLISAVARRVALVLEFHAQQCDWGAQVPGAVAQADQLSDHRALAWFDWTRYSSRQQQEMALGGVVGQWRLHGPSEVLARLWPWLHLGQWLHVGKNATMGMGGYHLTASSACAAEPGA